MRTPTANVAWSVRGFLIYLLALPLLPALLLELDGGSWWRSAVLGGSIGLLASAALLVRYGVRRQRQRAMSRYHRANTNVLTWLGCSAVAVAVGACQWLISGRSLAFSLALSAGAFGAAYLSYGSMWARPRPEATDGYSPDEIVDALREADLKVRDLESVYVRLPHGEIRSKLRKLVKKTHALLRDIELDPRLLRRSRKYLNVFLPGVQKVASTYRESRETAPDAEFDTRFKSLLDKTSRALDQQAEQRENKIAFDLDVQMAVLRQQLDQELRR
ncbi:MAG: 5-bromo-4-chloroindolyl phosphate hydrolysis family protein [Pseudomonadota bacterium]